jgi:hypothetical protein
MFAKEFKHKLIYSPFIIVDCNYRPDFYCPELGTFYEVTTDGACAHIKKKHLSCASKIAEVVIVNVFANTVVTAKYIPGNEVIEPTKLKIGIKKAEELIPELTKYLTVEANMKILSLLEKSFSSGLLKEFLSYQV